MTSQVDSRQYAVLDEDAVRNAGVSWEQATDGMPAPDTNLGSNFISRRYKDITFSVKRKIWRQNDEGMESVNSEYKTKRPQVLVKGGNKCVFCGFRSKHTEVHHCNDNHADNRDENLEIADPLCHGTQHIGQVGSQRQVSSSILTAFHKLKSITSSEPSPSCWRWATTMRRPRRGHSCSISQVAPNSSSLSGGARTRPTSQTPCFTFMRKTSTNA